MLIQCILNRYDSVQVPRQSNVHVNSMFVLIVNPFVVLVQCFVIQFFVLNPLLCEIIVTLASPPNIGRVLCRCVREVEG